MSDEQPLCRELRGKCLMDAMQFMAVRYLIRYRQLKTEMAHGWIAEPKQTRVIEKVVSKNAEAM
jgi:hypothetical protein